MTDDIRRFRVEVDKQIENLSTRGLKREALGELADILQCRLALDAREIPYSASLELIMRAVGTIIECAETDEEHGRYVIYKLYNGMRNLLENLNQHMPEFRETLENEFRRAP